MNDHELLGVEPSTPPDEIRKVYLSLVAIFHPDRYEAAPDRVKQEATRRMAEINAAYDRIRSGQAARSVPSDAANSSPPPDASAHAGSQQRPPPTVPTAGRMFVSQLPPRTLTHPLTLVQPVKWPTMDHPNVLWFGGDRQAAFTLLKEVGRGAGWSLSSEGSNMTIQPSWLAVRRRLLARARPMSFGESVGSGPSKGTAIGVFGTHVAELGRFFSDLRRGGRLVVREP